MEHSELPSDDANEIVVAVYGKPKCNQCDATKLRLDTLGVPYIYRDLVTDDIPSEERAAVDKLGYSSAPIVVITERGEIVAHWSQFRLDQIRALAVKLKAAQ